MNITDILRMLWLASMWGGSFIFMRVAAPGFGPVWLIEMRVLLAGLMFIPLVYRFKLLDQMKGHWGDFLILGCINFSFPFVLFAFASLYLPAGFSSILNATTPLFGTFVAFIWFKEKLTILRLVGFALGFAGVVILVGLEDFTLTSSLIAAIIAGLSAAIMYAFAAPYAKEKLAGVSPIATATGSLLAGAILLLPALPFTIPASIPNIKVVGAAIALAIFSTALAYLLYFQLLNNIGSTQTLTVTYLVPLFAIAWGWFFLGETVTTSMLVGGVLILSGVAISLKKAKKSDPTKKLL